MTEESAGRDADTYRPVPLRRHLTLAAALVLGAAAVVRLLGHARGDVGTSAPDLVGTVLLTGLALVLVAGAAVLLLSRVTVDDTRVVQQVGRQRRTLPLAPGTAVTLHREMVGAATGKRARWVLRLRRAGEAPIDLDDAAADLASVLDHVAVAGRRHPELLTDPTLRAVLDDPTLLDASGSELQVAVDDARAED